MSPFGDLEATIMHRMWQADAPRSVRDMLIELQQQREIAYTTVLTVMERLFRKGLLNRVPVGRAYHYSPSESRASYTARLMAEVLSDSTDTAETLVHFAQRVTAQEAKQLAKALVTRSGKPPVDT